MPIKQVKHSGRGIIVASMTGTDSFMRTPVASLPLSSKRGISADEARAEIVRTAGEFREPLWARRQHPVTRKAYLELAYPGGPPEPWTAEHEAELRRSCPLANM
jgi:hypothetical protein